MGKGDLILVIGGLLLLSMFTLSINSSITENRKTLYSSESVLNALALAEKYIEEAEALRFDEKKSATIPSSFTNPSRLGPDDNEYYPNFDDIDDFNYFTYTDTSSGNVPYTIQIRVFYTTLSNPDQISTSRTYFKRMVVNISSPFMKKINDKTITLKKLFAYHYFYSE
ncbi:hypothetical protein B6D60_01165 [candidate division KSB1 bacterium 4484_87]|nr:MAG: hypothetical protein B6D60_01165 [candidate division KSB1 bacterium 4484_87]